VAHPIDWGPDSRREKTPGLAQLQNEAFPRGGIFSFQIVEEYFLATGASPVRFRGQ